jgi:ACR3 family arsenite transporter
MAFLGWPFICNLFAPTLPADQINSYIAGLIILAAAPCTVMVSVVKTVNPSKGLFERALTNKLAGAVVRSLRLTN